MKGKLLSDADSSTHRTKKKIENNILYKDLFLRSWRNLKWMFKYSFTGKQID